MQINQLKRAVIYVRVSTKEQVDEGNSLNTQEKLCREYCIKNGYEVVIVYIEQGESAKTALRTELQKMLLFCSDKKNKIDAVIIYKLDRLSRNTDDYSQLRILLKRYGVEIKSTSEYFENTPQGKFMENMFANVAQFDNDVRAERCAGGMKDAMREGRYVWMAPVGYDNIKIASKATIGQNIVMAPLILQTFQTVAKNTHATEDVRKMMTAIGLRLKNGKPLSKQYFYSMLKNRVYMGMIEKFGESHKGLFDPIVDETLFNQVQKVLRARGKKMSQYKLDSEDFPLRRFIFNPDGKKLTGSWSKGRSKKYPFYRFEIKGSNYSRDKFEQDFMEYMDHYQIDLELISKLKAKLKEKLGKATESEQKDGRKLRAYVEELTGRQNILIKKNLDGFISDTVLKQQLDLIESEIYNSQINLASLQEMELDFDELLDYVQTYLENPSSVWKDAKLDKKLKLQWFQFPQGLVLENNNYGTAEIACVFKTKEAFLPLQSTMVDPTGLEPATPSLQMMCSTR
jgi:site-specific DNA recombinase